MPFAYPTIVGCIETLQTLCLIAASRMFFRSVETEDSQFCYATFWVVVGLLALLITQQVWWLRKALLRLEVTRVLPIEYGTVAVLSILGSVILFQEYSYVPHHFGWGIACGISLIVLGCGQVGSRYSPWPACGGLFARKPDMPAECDVAPVVPVRVVGTEGVRVVEDDVAVTWSGSGAL